MERRGRYKISGTIWNIETNGCKELRLQVRLLLTQELMLRGVISLMKNIWWRMLKGLDLEKILKFARSVPRSIWSDQTDSLSRTVEVDLKH